MAVRRTAQPTSDTVDHGQTSLMQEGLHSYNKQETDIDEEARAEEDELGLSFKY